MILSFNRGRRFWGGLTAQSYVQWAEKLQFQSRAAILGWADRGYTIKSPMSITFQSRAAILGWADVI